MKIKWLVEEREIPYVGVLKPGEVYTLSEEQAKSLITQGVAEAFKIIMEKPIKAYYDIDFNMGVE